MDRVTRDIDDDAKGLNAVRKEKDRWGEHSEENWKYGEQYSQEEWDRQVDGLEWEKQSGQYAGVNGLKGKGKRKEGAGKGAFHGDCYNC